MATWSIEYRRVGHDGGGWPGTLEDAAAAADHLAAVASEHPLDIGRAIAIGHSAGGHIALWLAGRADSAIRLRGVISLAGVADLRRGYELGLGNGAVAAFAGGSPDEFPERYRAASPIERLPLEIPQWLIHGTRDDIVPIELSECYAAAAGGAARLLALDGADHFDPIDPRTTEWTIVEQSALTLAARP